MKALISMVFVTLLFAAPLKADMDPDEVMVNFCAYVKDHSHDVMVDRQMGREFTWVMEKYGVCEWSKAVVREAFYNYPRYLTQASQEEVIQEFAQESFIMCMQVVTDEDGK